MEQTPVYDIRTSENAMKTLVALTGVSQMYGNAIFPAKVSMLILKI